jgi:chemotaxis protein CheX
MSRQAFDGGTDSSRERDEAVLLNGVRVAGASGRNGDRSERERAMAVSLRESIQLVSDPKNLDDSVEEVFRLMLGVECRRDPARPSLEKESVTAVVGFGGLLSGACVFRSGSRGAMEIAARMTGMEFSTIDGTVQDAIGEICNMLAGAWKGKIPELAAHCGLSVPAVITGHDYNLHVQAPEFQVHHVYRFGEECFEVTIVCDGLL